MRHRLVLGPLLAAAVTAAPTADAVEAPAPRVEGGALAWSPVDARTINVHRGDGSYLESLPGSATRWTAPAPGRYFLVGADGGDWRGWERSDTVEVRGAGDPGAGGPGVADLRASVYSSTALELFWRPGAGAVRFEVRRDGALVARTDGRSRFEDGLAPGTGYRYEVVALDRDGRRGPPARVDIRTAGGAGSSPANPFEPVDPVEPTPTPTEPAPTGPAAPGAPRALRRDVYSGRSAELFWDAPAAGPVARYEILRNGRAIGESTGRSFFDPGLYPGVTWAYAVRAVDGRGRISAPATLRFTTDGAPVDPGVPALPAAPAPAPPSNLRVVAADDDSLELAWVPGEGDANGRYAVYRDGARAGTTAATRFAVDGLLSGTAYRFAVRALGPEGAPDAGPIDVDALDFPAARGVARAVGITGGPSAVDLSPGGGVLPADCLVASGTGLRFCFTPGTRELLAVRGDGTTWWRFAVPGEPSTNDVRHLAWTRGTLVLVANVRNASGERAWEMSTFAPRGAFRNTFALDAPAGRSIDADDPGALVARGGRHGLLVAAPLRDDPPGAGGGTDAAASDTASGTSGAAGADVAALRYDVSTGRVAAFRPLPAPAGLPLAFTRGSGEGRDTFGVEAGGALFTLEERLLDDGTGVPAPTPGARHSVRELVAGWLDAEAVAGLRLGGQLPLPADARVLDTVVDPAGRVVTRTLECPGGGRAAELSPPGRAFVLWHYRFDACVIGDRRLSGETRATSAYGGARLGGSTDSASAFTDFGVRWANGDEVRASGERTGRDSFGFGRDGPCGTVTGSNGDDDFAFVRTRFGGLSADLDALRGTASVDERETQVRDADGRFACAGISTRTGRATARVRADVLGGVPGDASRDVSIVDGRGAGGAATSEAVQSIVLDDGAFQRDAPRSLANGTVTSEVGGAGGATAGTFVDRWRFDRP